MANNYLQFSFDFIVPKAHRAWVSAVETAMDNPDDYSALLEEVFQSSLSSDVEFSLNFNSEDGVCWIYAEESGNVDQVAYFLAALLKRCHATHEDLNKIGFTYSETCSTMRCNEFGGGYHVAALVGDEVRHYSANAYDVMEAIMDSKQGPLDQSDT